MSIPVETIARIFEKVSYKRDDTKITANTLKLSAEYIKLFIDEAIVRSNQHRIDEGESKVDGIDNDIDDIVSGEEMDDIDIPGVTSTSTIDTKHLSQAAGVLVLDF